jgi:hypothetical protein
MNNENTFFKRKIYLWRKDHKPTGVPDQNTQNNLQLLHFETLLRNNKRYHHLVDYKQREIFVFPKSLCKMYTFCITKLNNTCPVPLKTQHSVPRTATKWRDFEASGTEYSHLPINKLHRLTARNTSCSTNRARTFSAPHLTPSDLTLPKRMASAKQRHLNLQSTVCACNASHATRLSTGQTPCLYQCRKAERGVR